MTKDQLEEVIINDFFTHVTNYIYLLNVQVWEEQDHMRPEDWDPKTFFAMHDLNGDNHWDEDEVRVIENR